MTAIVSIVLYGVASLFAFLLGWMLHEAGKRHLDRAEAMIIGATFAMSVLLFLLAQLLQVRP
ncbi:hypothetical protein [Rhizobium sp. CAU 1783]